ARDGVLRVCGPRSVQRPRFARTLLLDQTQEPTERDPGIPGDRYLVRVAASGLGRVDIQLHDWHPDLRNRPTVGDLIAGPAADEEHEVGFTDDPVRTFARVGAHHSYAQRVVLGDAVLAVQRCRDRHLKHLG